MAPSATTQEVLMGEHLTASPPDEDQSETEPLVDGDLLVEEISIDGMCGVY
jgi:mycofactocin precursor